jgi:hypothetical protein
MIIERSKMILPVIFVEGIMSYTYVRMSLE